MLAYFDADHQRDIAPLGRFHPWTIAEKTPGGRYVNFRERPDLIESTLEDLIPLKGNAVAREVVQFLEWANGGESVYESNDFGLRPIKNNESGISRSRLELHGRLTLLLRVLDRNTNEQALWAFMHEVEARLKANEPAFRQACWGWFLWPHKFTELEDAGRPAMGYCPTFLVWSWGDTETETYDNFTRALNTLRSVLSEPDLMRHWS